MVWVPAGEFLMGSSEAEVAAAMQRDPQARKDPAGTAAVIMEALEVVVR